MGREGSVESTSVCMRCSNVARSVGEALQALERGELGRVRELLVEVLAGGGRGGASG